MGYLFRRSTVQKSPDNGVQSHPCFSYADNTIHVCH